MEPANHKRPESAQLTAGIETLTHKTMVNSKTGLLSEYWRGKLLIMPHPESIKYISQQMLHLL